MRNTNQNGVILTRLQEDKDLFSEEEIAAHGTMPKSLNKIMTVSIVCDVSKDIDKYKPTEYQHYIKSNFGFIDDLYDNLCTFKTDEEQTMKELAKSETGRATLAQMSANQSNKEMKEISLYHNAMQTTIGVQVFVRQSNHLYETHFIHCDEVDKALQKRRDVFSE